MRDGCASPHSPRGQTKHLQNVRAILAPPIGTMKGNEPLAQDETSDDDREGEDDEGAECDSKYEEINRRCSEVLAAAAVAPRGIRRCGRQRLTHHGWHREDSSAQ